MIPVPSTIITSNNVELPFVGSASVHGPQWPLRFDNRRELWRIKRAAKKLNMNLNTYMRAVLQHYSVKVLANGKRHGA